MTKKTNEQGISVYQKRLVLFGWVFNIRIERHRRSETNLSSLSGTPPNSTSVNSAVDLIRRDNAYRRK